MNPKAESESALPVWRSLSESSGPYWKVLKRGYVSEALLNLISSPPGAVLDVGCFCSAVGEWLKANYSEVRVVGVEPLAQAASQARQVLDCVLEGKLEDVSLAQADVLEHMYDPWRALQQLREALKPGVVVLASIPNILNWIVVERLVRGDFEYADSRILDITHLWFLTLSGIRRLIEETGYRIDHVMRIFDPRCEKLREGPQQQVPIQIDSDLLQVEGQTHEGFAELATRQFWIRAVPA